MVEKEFQKVADRVHEYLNKEPSGHDFHHAVRVLNNALHIYEKEHKGDRHVIGVAALVHDICRPWEKKTGKSHFGPEALEIIASVLTDAGENDIVIAQVLDIVRLHDVYDWSNPQDKTVELKIVQDADNLDAIGAIGIARTFAFAGAHNCDMYIPGEDLEFRDDFVEDPNHRTSIIAHFYEKLLKLKDNMNTETGKSIAEGRHKIMVEYLDQFMNEWEGTS